MKTRIITAALVALAALLAGCGGSGTTGYSSPVATTPVVSATTGRAQVSLVWPARTASRKIPLDANSVLVQFLSGTTVVGSQLLTRPAHDGTPTTVTFTNLPGGALTVKATAFPNADGTGAAQGIAQAPTTIVVGQSTPVTLTLATTITRVDILPQNIALTTTPTTITAVAYDASNNIVITNQWNWTNSDNTVAALIPSGNTATIAAVGVGNSLLTLTEGESGQQAQKKLVVTPVP